MRLIAFVWVTLVCASARADAVDALDPLAADICGGSPHSPGCSPLVLGLGCMGAVAAVVSLAAVIGLFVMRGRREDGRQGPR